MHPTSNNKINFSWPNEAYLSSITRSFPSNKEIIPKKELATTVCIWIIISKSGVLLGLEKKIQSHSRSFGTNDLPFKVKFCCF